jgi:hypothetical protein
MISSLNFDQPQNSSGKSSQIVLQLQDDNKTPFFKYGKNKILKENSVLDISYVLHFF